MAFYVKHGMGGGYNSVSEWYIVDVDTLEEAETWAFESACDDFESSGEFDFEEFAEDNPDAKDGEDWEAYCQERESWIEYQAVEGDTIPDEE